MTILTTLRSLVPGLRGAKPVDRPLFLPASPEVLEYGKSPACQAAIAATNAIVFDALPKNPPINPVSLEHRKILVEAGLTWQMRYQEHQIRLEACKALGLAVYDDQGGADLLAGRPTKVTRLKGWREFSPDIYQNRIRLEALNDLRSRVDGKSEIGHLSSALIRDDGEIVVDSFRAFGVPGQERLVYGPPRRSALPHQHGGRAAHADRQDLHLLGSAPLPRFRRGRPGVLLGGPRLQGPPAVWGDPGADQPQAPVLRGLFRIARPLGVSTVSCHVGSVNHGGPIHW
jgi:hypothetical protein